MPPSNSWCCTTAWVEPRKTWCLWGNTWQHNFPNAFIVSVHAPYASDLGSNGSNSAGAQWFSVQDITEENRPARVAEALLRLHRQPAPLANHQRRRAHRHRRHRLFTRSHHALEAAH